jgi:acyl-CoA thioester hydrolase
LNRPSAFIAPKANSLPLAQCSIRVYYEDTDLAGVVYYANYLKFFERVRTEWLREIGLENLKLLQEEKVVFVVTECHVKYLQAAKLDDVLVATVENYQSSKVRASLEQRILRDGTAICTAIVTFACVEVGTGIPVRLPIQLRSTRLPK